VTNTPAIVATIVVYMGICLTLGFVAYRRTTNLADFILGGRSLGSWVTAFSAQASDMSGWLLMGLPGLAYLAGFDAVWLAAGLIVGTYLNWKFIAGPLRVRTEQLGDSLTLPDYFERRFGDRSRILRTLTAAFILVFFTFYASSGFVATGRLFESLFGMHYHDAMFWGSVVMLAYTFFGGFLALVLVAALGVGLAGGFGELASTLEARNPALLDPYLGSDGQALGLIGIASLLAWGLGYPGQPHILARFMAIRSADEMPTARRVAMVWVIVVLLAAVVVGFAGAAIIAPPLVGPDSEKVFILMATAYLHPILAGICLSGILAAIMSTASAQLLVASSAFAQDFYKGLFRHDPGRVELLWVGRGAVLTIALLAYLLALNPENKVLDLVAWAWAGFGAAFGPAIVLSLYWPRMTRNGALAGMLVGGLTVILWKQGSGGIFALYEMVPGVLLSAVAIWLTSRFDSTAR
jgi:sodium/proline symporter